MRQTHLAFDDMRSQGFLAGEMVWNFADFMTAQNVKRAVGNRKGMLTRNRQPKMAAYLLKRRYETLSANKTQTCSDYAQNKNEKSNDIDFDFI
jgi:beta-glucuronidase